MILARLFWLLVCPRVNDAHVRDWFAWDSMGLSRCLHCKREMPDPPIQRRTRL